MGRCAVVVISQRHAFLCSGTSCCEFATLDGGSQRSVTQFAFTQQVQLTGSARKLHTRCIEQLTPWKNLRTSRQQRINKKNCLSARSQKGCKAKGRELFDTSGVKPVG